MLMSFDRILQKIIHISLIIKVDLSVMNTEMMTTHYTRQDRHVNNEQFRLLSLTIKNNKMHEVSQELQIQKKIATARKE